MKNLSSVVSAEARYGLDSPGMESCLSQYILHLSQPALSPPTHYAMGTGLLATEGVVQLRHGINRPPPFSAEV
jgi:hypothetical protein